jgi:hypothetical protein
VTVASYAAQPPRVDYVEDGVTLVHSIPFKFFDAADLTVKRITADGETETLLVSPTHYSITGGAVAGVCATGSITMVAGGDAGDTLRIDRNTALSQLVVYDPTDEFPARSHQEAIDRLEMEIQEIRRDMLTRRDVFDIIVATLIAGPGIDFDIDNVGGHITINNTLLDPAVFAQTIYNILREGAGIDISLDTILNLITISSAQLTDLPDCVMLSGDQQDYDGAFGGTGSRLTTEDVQDIIGGMILAGTGITAAYDDTLGKVTVGCSITQYTDEQVRDTMAVALVAGTAITLNVDDPGNTITINSTALDATYKGIVPTVRSGAFDFANNMNGRATVYDGSAANATLRLEADVALDDGWTHVVRVKPGHGPLTIHRVTSGVTLYVNGGTTSADATIVAGGEATIIRQDDNEFTITGVGVS